MIFVVHIQRNIVKCYARWILPTLLRKDQLDLHSRLQIGETICFAKSMNHSCPTFKASDRWDNSTLPSLKTDASHLFPIQVCVKGGSIWSTPPSLVGQKWECGGWDAFLAKGRQLEVGYNMHYDEKSLTGSGWRAGRGGGGGGGEGGRAGTHCCCQEGSRGEWNQNEALTAMYYMGKFKFKMQISWFGWSTNHWPDKS